jgi:hypothetical protein
MTCQLCDGAGVEVYDDTPGDQTLERKCVCVLDDGSGDYDQKQEN